MIEKDYVANNYPYPDKEIKNIYKDKEIPLPDYLSIVYINYRGDKYYLTEEYLLSKEEKKAVIGEKKEIEEIMLRKIIRINRRGKIYYDNYELELEKDNKKKQIDIKGTAIEYSQKKEYLCILRVNKTLLYLDDNGYFRYDISNGKKFNKYNEAVNEGCKQFKKLINKEKQEGIIKANSIIDAIAYISSSKSNNIEAICSGYIHGMVKDKKENQEKLKVYYYVDENSQLSEEKVEDKEHNVIKVIDKLIKEIMYGNYTLLFRAFIVKHLENDKLYFMYNFDFKETENELNYSFRFNIESEKIGIDYSDLIEF